MTVTLNVMDMNNSVRKLLICLECGHPFFERVPDISRRCGSCASSSVVEREELKTASAAIKPWAHLYRGGLPPIPSPSELLGFPVSLGLFFNVLSKAKSNIARRRAAQIMLEDAGFNKNEAMDTAQKMYP